MIKRKKKGIYSVARRATDILWSKYRRTQQNWTCEVCGRVYLPDNAGNLGVMHYHGRSHENVRFDEDNTPVACNIPCHQYFDTHKTEFKDWMVKKLGQQRFDLLEVRAHLRKHRDDVSDKIIIKQLIKELE